MSSQTNIVEEFVTHAVASARRTGIRAEALDSPGLNAQSFTIDARGSDGRRCVFTVVSTFHGITIRTENKNPVKLTLEEANIPAMAERFISELYPNP